MDLGDIDFGAVSEILATLSEEDMENLSSMASEMLGSGAFTAGNRQEKQRKDKEKATDFSFGDFSLDGESIAKIMRLMNRLQNQPEDQRIKLLNTLKPMLSKQRRSKVDEAVQILKIMSIIPLLRD